jgi:hypothetical protein
MLNLYWEYAGTRYRSKFRALDAANGNYKGITFRIHESEDFDNYTWSIEPTPSLKEIMKQRALQLRDTYAYLKLWFSGGGDSTTVLNTFIENNIHLDEICVYRYAFDDDFDNNQGDYEINTYTLPYLKKLQHYLPKTRIKIIHNGKDYYDKVLNDDKWFFSKSNLSLRHTYLPKINGKNFCNILGCSDPLVIYNKGHWYNEIWDAGESEYANLRNIELFFTSVNMPELHAKQCHIMKNYLTKHNMLDNDMVKVKAVLRAITRDTPVAPEPDFFAKNYQFHETLYLLPKDKYQYKSANKEQMDRVKYLFKNATINGCVLPKLMTQYRAKQLYLGENV